MKRIREWDSFLEHAVRLDQKERIHFETEMLEIGSYLFEALVRITTSR
ncbi:MAG: hypothetical protein IPG90_18060 [Bacteroidetes bacterium]|nr:hypothetical protein [Bacteroidota bacterium]